MPNATRILRNRIVLFFDFDGTLAPSTTPVLAKALELNHDKIAEQVNAMQRDGWQYAIAKAEVFRQLGATGADVTRQRMEEVGEGYECYPGAEDFVERLREHARGIDEDVELEFVMLTAGFRTIPAASPVGETFDRIYAGDLNFDADGLVLGVKKVITHADKVHYIRQLVEGVNVDQPDELEDTYVEHAPEDHYVPMDQVIFVGDGASDMSAFQTVGEGGGIGVAIDKQGQEWDGYEEMSKGRRVMNLAPPDYTEGSELMRTLEHAVASMIYRVKVLRLGEGE